MPFYSVLSFMYKSTFVNEEMLKAHFINYIALFIIDCFMHSALMVTLGKIITVTRRNEHFYYSVNVMTDVR